MYTLPYILETFINALILGFLMLKAILKPEKIECGIGKWQDRTLKWNSQKKNLVR